MPSLTFVLPHWLYWSGLVILPLLAMVLVRRRRGGTADSGLSIPIAYMLWLWSGFVGMRLMPQKDVDGHGNPED